MRPEGFAGDDIWRVKVDPVRLLRVHRQVRERGVIQLRHHQLQVVLAGELCDQGDAAVKGLAAQPLSIPAVALAELHRYVRTC